MSGGFPRKIPLKIGSIPDVFFPTNGEYDLVHMPDVAAARAATANFIGVGLSEFQTPLPHRFIGDDDPTLCKKLFNITETERKTEIQPDSMANDFRWEAGAFVVGSNGVRFHEIIVAHGSTTLSN